MKRMSLILWTLLFVIAVVVFALMAHRDTWGMWRWTCLLLAGLGLCGGWVVVDDPVRTVLGESRRSFFDSRIALVICFGAVAVLGYRRLLHLDLLPTSLHWFVLPAIGIGAVEEILWRGWVQGAFTKTLGSVQSVFIAAGAHAAYKTALFVFPPVNIAARTPIALWLIAGFTFGMGVMLGGLRVRQGTIIPAVALHIVFDILVYGQCEVLPWWVW